MTDLWACLQAGAPLWIVIGMALLLWPLGWLVLWVRDAWEAVEALEEGGRDEDDSSGVDRASTTALQP